jgi:hypothetical protein
MGQKTAQKRGRRNMVEKEQTLQPVNIGTADFQVIGDVLMPYAKMIRSTVKPSPKRDTLLTIIETLRQRIAAAKTSLVGELATTPAQKAESLFPLTHAELAVIDNAFRAFVTNLGLHISQSAERDDIIRACEALRVHIMSGCSSPDTPTAPSSNTIPDQ